MDASPPVFVITGQLAAGKSTLAAAVLEQFDSGFHIDVDGIREMVKSGLASPLEWTDETTRQFDLAIAGSAALAKVYASAGFAVVIEGGLAPASVEEALGRLGLTDRLVGIVLHPRLDVALQRNRERRSKSFDTSILDDVIREIDADIAREPDRPGWHRLDNSDEPIEATVERILSFPR
ncbi:MAG: ATP-binding protein [Chloroflexota bacterium]|nr:ATP-binding protein [Chloroflexota bacterium]